MKSSFSTTLKTKNALGVFLIVLGILCNEWIFEKVFSTYAVMEFNKRIPIWAFELVLITLGLILIFVRTEKKSLEKLSEYYKLIAITLFNTFLLFVFANLLASSVLAVKDIFFYRNQIFLKYGELPSNLYPDLGKKQINELLRETWSRPYSYEPYTQFKERSYKGKYINVSEHGFRHVKDQGPWPPDPKSFNIFLFGGSTAFNYGVSDENTIASYLQEMLSNIKPNNGIYVYNFGRGNYFSSQERVLFQKLLVDNFIPDLAIFIDGINDFYHYDGTPFYTSRLQRLLDDKGHLFEVPLIKIVEELKSNYRGVNNLEMEEEKYNNIDLIKRVIGRYTANKKLIEASGKTFNVKTVFVWQPSPTYKYDLKYHKFAKDGFRGFTYSKYGYEQMEKIKSTLGNNFLWLADIQDGVTKPLYVDIDHYSEEMSKEIAKNIYNFLARNNLTSL